MTTRSDDLFFATLAVVFVLWILNLAEFVRRGRNVSLSEVSEVGWKESIRRSLGKFTWVSVLLLFLLLLSLSLFAYLAIARA